MSTPVRRDWLATRAEFERAEAREAAARAAAARSEAARSALRAAEESFPAIPVASRYARRLRERYLGYVAQHPGVDTSPAAYARHSAEGYAFLVSFLVLVAALFFLVRRAWDPASSVFVNIAVLAVLGTFVLLVWVFAVAEVSLSIARAVSAAQYAAVARDIGAYQRWLDSIDSARRDADARLCVCAPSRANPAVHDVDCPALYV